MKDKQKTALEAIAKMHVLLHTAEAPKGEITYLEIVRICDYLKKEYFNDQMPEQLETAFRQAKESCKPSTLEGINTKNRTHGLLLLVPGLVIGLLGFGSIFSYGINIHNPTGRWIGGQLWDYVSGNPPRLPTSEVNWTAILSTAIGVVMIASAIYMLRRRAQPKFQASIAEGILSTGITNWAETSNDP